MTRTFNDHPYMDTARRGICDVCDLPTHGPMTDQITPSVDRPRTASGRSLLNAIEYLLDRGETMIAVGKVQPFILAIEVEAASQPPAAPDAPYPHDEDCAGPFPHVGYCKAAPSLREAMERHFGEMLSPKEYDDIVRIAALASPEPDGGLDVERLREACIETGHAIQRVAGNIDDRPSFDEIAAEYARLSGSAGDAPHYHNDGRGDAEGACWATHRSAGDAPEPLPGRSCRHGINPDECEFCDGPGADKEEASRRAMKADPGGYRIPRGDAPEDETP